MVRFSKLPEVQGHQTGRMTIQEKIVEYHITQER